MEIAIDITTDLKIKAKTWGNKNGKPVLALHGWLDNANTFDKIAPLLTQDLYIVAVDLTGHGLSDHRPTNSSYYLWDYASDILQFIQELEWGKFTILAHSMGTGIASIICGAMPNLVDKLICIDGLGAPFVVDEEKVVSNFKRSIQQLNMAKKSKLYGFSDPSSSQFKTKEEAIENRVNNIIGPISTDAAAILTERSLKEVPEGYRWAYDPRIVLPECYKMTESQAQQFVEAIKCDTLIILGKEGLFITEKNKERLNKFQNATVHWLPGGHHLHLEDAHSQISILINQFLKTEYK